METDKGKHLLTALISISLIVIVYGNVSCKPAELYGKHTIIFTFSSQEAKNNFIEIESMYKHIGTCNQRTMRCITNIPDELNITLVELDDKYTISVMIYNVTRKSLFNNDIWFSVKYGNPFLNEILMCRLKIIGPPTFKHANGKVIKELILKINDSVTLTVELDSYPKPNHYIVFKRGSHTHVFENVTSGNAESDDITIAYREDGTINGTLYINLTVLEQKDFTNYLIIIDNGIRPWLEYTFSIIEDRGKDEINEDELSPRIVLGVSISTASLFVIVVFISAYCCCYSTGSAKKKKMMDHQNEKNAAFQNDTALSIQIDDTRVKENFKWPLTRRVNREYDVISDNVMVYTHNYNAFFHDITQERHELNVLDNFAPAEYEYITPTDEYPAVIELSKIEDVGYISPIN